VEATEFEFIVIAMVLSSLIYVFVCGQLHAAPIPVGRRESFPATFPRKVNCVVFAPRAGRVCGFAIVQAEPGQSVRDRTAPAERDRLAIAVDLQRGAKPRFRVDRLEPA
jgi:hypothetical protein